MSVEKITEEAQSKLPSSTVTDTTRLENVRSNNTSEETPQQLDDGLAADGEKQEEEGSVAAAEQGGGGEVGISVPEPLWKAAKAWFHGLGAEERSAAASFAEEPFLISIVARAASSTARTAAATRSGDREMEADWSTMVSIEEFEANYNKCAGAGAADSEMDETPKLANKKTTGKSMAAASVSAEKGGGSVEKEERLASSDGAKKDIGFRIQSFEDGEATIAAPPKQNIASSSGVDDRTLRFAKQFLNHVAIIFPSAVKHVGITGMSQQQPTLIVRPTFFAASNNVEELFLTMEQCAGAQFLLRDEADLRPNDALLWLRQLFKGGKGDRSVPLYVLVLARIGWAIGESFRAQKQETAALPNTEERLEDAGVEIALTDQNSRPPVETQGTLGDLFSHCRALGDLTMTMKASVLAGFFSPLAEACLLNQTQNSVEAGNVENMIMIPLSRIILSVCARSVDLPLLDIDLTALDKAVADSLQKMADHGSTADPEVSVATSIIPSNDDASPTKPTKRGSGNGASSHKKKKKKNKKRKNKKTSQSEGQPNSQKSAPVAEVSGPTDEKKADQQTSKPVSDKKVHQQGPVGDKASQQNSKPSAEKKPSDPVVVSVVPKDEPLSLKKASKEKKQMEEEKFPEEKPRAESVTTVVSLATSVNSEDTDIDATVSAFVAGPGKGKAEIAPMARSGRFSVASPKPSPAPETKNDVSLKVEENETATSVGNHPDHHDDGDAWETVEKVRGRSSRKKPPERMHQQQHAPRHFNHSSTSGSHDSHGGYRKSKNSRAAKSRNKAASRRIVREILFAVVDSVEDEVQKKQAAAAAAVATAASPLSPKKVVNPWKKGPPGAAAVKPQPVTSVPPPRKDFASVVAAKPKPEKPSMRDVVARNAREQPPAKKEPNTLNHENRPPRVSEAPTTTGESTTTKVAKDSPAKRSPGKRSKKGNGGPADQNTATTYQETVSAVSAASNARVDSLENLEEVQDRESEGSPADTDEAQHNRDRVASDAAGDSTSNPPLPTLLSPERGNSATSSVASSLEAPHAAHPHRHSATAVDVNDVGYHLLDVCDKLSRDMSLFMSRRALALSARRRERGAILAALQDCVSEIWPGKGHVEQYGSCATQLDLPSSDIDVVVRGLDQNYEAMNSSHSVPSINGSKSAGSAESLTPAMSFDNSEEAHPHIHQFAPAYGMMPTHLNGERVVRLAADIEKQPWAVQVNAIPTASVPVIKILCDPSRLTGGSHGGEWMAKHQNLPAQAAAAAGKNHPQAEAPSNEEQQGSFPQHTLLPWRGSDVMKGLLMLDITFEGPEHGGIGSTEFSALAVADACAETGLPPDATPFVQVLMVLKELLSQRKLNEPYSGGLSSYALLLLVVALMRERAVIKEEIERVELQRKAMVSSELDAMKSASKQSDQQHNASVSASTATHQASKVEKTSQQKQKTAPKKEDSANNNKSCEAKESRAPTKKAGKKTHSKQKHHSHHQSGGLKEDKKTPPSSESSWAHIAKKNAVAAAAKPANKSGHKKGEPKSNQSENKPPPPAKKPSFAEAVTGSAQAPDASSSTEKGNGAHTKSKTSAATKQPAKQVTNAETPPSKVKSDETKSSNVQTASSKIETHQKLQTRSSLHVAPPFYPQGFNDIVEVLCSGETTAGKLLMHFLLYYGQHFDAQGTAIDISGKHERDYYGHPSPYSYFSPYIQRRAPGSIDPITGMLVVDPIVIYDPLEGSEHKNVARRCFAWNSVRWIFAQSYATLASAVERSATPPATPGGPPSAAPSCDGRDRDAAMYDTDAMGDLMDPSSPLLRCLLSF